MGHVQAFNCTDVLRGALPKCAEAHLLRQEVNDCKDAAQQQASATSSPTNTAASGNKCASRILSLNVFALDSSRQLPVPISQSSQGARQPSTRPQRARVLSARESDANALAAQPCASFACLPVYDGCTGFALFEVNLYKSISNYKMRTKGTQSRINMPHTTRIGNTPLRTEMFSFGNSLKLTRYFNTFAKFYCPLCAQWLK